MKIRRASSTYFREFTPLELESAIDNCKPGKTAETDGIYPEYIKNCGKKTKNWMCKFLNNILLSGILPKELKKSIIIAILKPLKPDDKPKSYRAIALLSICYKILERLIAIELLEQSTMW